MVTAAALDNLREAVAAVPDPEIRVLTIEEIGILREVRDDPGGAPVVTITPTYSGCPAMDLVRAEIRDAAAAAGFPGVRVETVWSPAWTTEWIGPAARAKLARAGIAPPPPAAPPGATAPEGARLLPLARVVVRCPRCGSPETTEVARFGSTACKALWRCAACHEPFDHFKEH
jgi:ring-1,2-phenylacetyl-CoA epoxidase subunit PaaD